mgnify:CR=1 FL=1
MYLVVGLGNHGSKYLLNRHNIGFILVDALAQFESTGPFNNAQKALISKGQIEGERVILAKPQTYMNLSGDSVGEIMSYYKIEAPNLIVIQDDIDQEFGKIKLQKARGHGGHNGIRDIHRVLGSNDYVRLKFGVGRPSNKRMDVADYVLQDFTVEEQNEFRDLLSDASDCVCSFIKNGYDKTANLFNQRK